MKGMGRTTKGFLWVGAVAFVLVEALLVRAGDVGEAVALLPVVAIVAILVLLARAASRSPQRREDPSLGLLERRGKEWIGRLAHPLFPGREIEIHVEARTEEEFAARRHHVERLAAAPEAVREEIRQGAFETYEMYRTEAEPGEIWRGVARSEIEAILRPKEWRLYGGDDGSTRSRIWCELEWPNPHGLAVYLSDDRVEALQPEG